MWDINAHHPVAGRLSFDGSYEVEVRGVFQTCRDTGGGADDYSPEGEAVLTEHPDVFPCDISGKLRRSATSADRATY